jgi:hypothetical protein
LALASMCASYLCSLSSILACARAGRAELSERRGPGWTKCVKKLGREAGSGVPCRRSRCGA